DQGARFRVQGQRHALGGGGALARMVVRRGADPAKREHDVAPSQGALQGGGDLGRIVAQVLGPVELQSARRQRGDHAREMLVGALARQDFVTDDEYAYAHEPFRFEFARIEIMPQDASAPRSWPTARKG